METNVQVAWGFGCLHSRHYKMLSIKRPDGMSFYNILFQKDGKVLSKCTSLPPPSNLRLQACLYKKGGVGGDSAVTVSTSDSYN